MVPETQEIILQLGALSYAGIWLTSFIANVIIPIPEEAVLLLLGYIIGTKAINGYIVIPLVISGLLASDLIIYFLSERGSRIVTWFYDKIFSKRIARQGNNWVNANIGKIIVISRFLIHFRFLGPFIAGQRKIGWKTFVKYDLLALVIYVPVYVLLGIYFQNKIGLIIGKVEVVRNIILLSVVLLLLWGILKISYRWFFKKVPTYNESDQI